MHAHLLALFAFAPTLAVAHAHGASHDEALYLRKLRARHPGAKARVLHARAPATRSTRTAAASPTVNNVATTSLTGILAEGNPGLLTQIGSTTFPEATSPLPTTYASGASVPVTGASPLPGGVIIPSQWPVLDRVPPVNSPQVSQWLAQVDMSKVPNIPVTQPGGCANASNAQSVAQASANGWWTCGGYTRSTDVTSCPTTNTWGSSYDDGPSPYTPKLLDFLDSKSLKTTFFIVGSRAISRPAMLQYEVMDGHQVCVHTWSHPYLTTLTNAQIVAELGWTKYAIKQITGLTPNTMRPPYGDIDDRVRAISLQMGLTPIIWTSANGKTFDTEDWQIGAGTVSTTTVLQNFQNILAQASSLSTGFIVLEHDLYQQSVDLAVNFVLPYALTVQPKLTLEPIITCLGKDMSEAYIETASNTTTTSNLLATNAVAAAVAPTSIAAVPIISSVGSTTAQTSAAQQKPVSATTSIEANILWSLTAALGALSLSGIV